MLRKRDKEYTYPLSSISKSSFVISNI